MYSRVVRAEIKGVMNVRKVYESILGRARDELLGNRMLKCFKLSKEMLYLQLSILYNRLNENIIQPWFAL